MLACWHKGEFGGAEVGAVDSRPKFLKVYFTLRPRVLTEEIGFPVWNTRRILLNIQDETRICL